MSQKPSEFHAIVQDSYNPLSKVGGWEGGRVRGGGFLSESMAFFYKFIKVTVQLHLMSAINLQKLVSSSYP